MAISCRGNERAHLLKRWLAVLKEIQKLSELSSEDKQSTLEQDSTFDDLKDSPRKPFMVRKVLFFFYEIIWVESLIDMT